VPHEIAHSVRGRLRVRYPVSWFRVRRTVVESRLRDLPGVRRVSGSMVTGSVRIEYDPFQLAEHGLVEVLKQIDAHIDGGGAVARRRSSARPGTQVVARRAPLLNFLGASSVLAVACSPASPSVVAALVLASELPSMVRAAGALRRRQVNGEVLEAPTLLLLATRRHYVAAALLTWLRTLGEYVVARTVVDARRSLHDVIAPPDAVVDRVEGDAARPVAVSALRTGDVVVAPAGHRLAVDGPVVDGEALVDQQTMTGEALPVERRAGDTVFAATTVEHGEISVRVDRVGFDTAVGRIVQAIEASAGEKGRARDAAAPSAKRPSPTPSAARTPMPRSSGRGRGTCPGPDCFRHEQIGSRAPARCAAPGGRTPRRRRQLLALPRCGPVGRAGASQL
jgi:cation transport ATPase